MRVQGYVRLGWGGAGLVLAWVVARTILAYGDLDPSGTELLKRWIIAGYESYHLGRSELTLEEKAELLKQSRQIAFKSVAARGHARNLVVKVELVPNPAHPPSMQTTQYFRMRYSATLGWGQVPQPASAETYFLALFFL